MAQYHGTRWCLPEQADGRNIASCWVPLIKKEPPQLPATHELSKKDIKQKIMSYKNIQYMWKSDRARCHSLNCSTEFGNATCNATYFFIPTTRSCTQAHSAMKCQVERVHLRSSVVTIYVRTVLATIENPFEPSWSASTKTCPMRKPCG